MSQTQPFPTIIKHPVGGANYATVFGSSSTSGLNQMQLFSANFDSQNILAFDSMGIPYSYNSSTGLAALNAGNIVIKCGAYQMTVTVSPFSGELTVQ